MSYATDHAGALADLTASGAAVTFSYSTVTYTPATDAQTTTSATVTGYAMQVKGEPRQYQALELIESEAPTLLFAPTTYGSLPPLRSTLTWGGETYSVRAVSPLAPDGTAILARVVVAR